MNLDAISRQLEEDLSSDAWEPLRPGHVSVWVSEEVRDALQNLAWELQHPRYGKTLSKNDVLVAWLKVEGRL